MNLKYIGLINEHLIFNRDDSNITSKNNSYIYNKILDGSYQSQAVNYLNNIGMATFNGLSTLLIQKSFGRTF